MNNPLKELEEKRKEILKDRRDSDPCVGCTRENICEFICERKRIWWKQLK